MPKEPVYIVSVKPAPGSDGPLLVSDDQELVRLVIERIRRTYTPPPPVRPIHPGPEAA